MSQGPHRADGADGTDGAAGTDGADGGHPDGGGPDHQDLAFPALLRAARTTYRSAIRSALAEAACDDVPRNGIFVLGSIARGGSPLGQIITALGVSKQAAGQLVDTLVVRGYLDRTPDPEDRRRMTVALTGRGRQAADAARSAIEQVDRALVARAGADAVAACRATLTILIGLRSDPDS